MTTLFLSTVSAPSVRDDGSHFIFGGLNYYVLTSKISTMYLLWSYCIATSVGESYFLWKVTRYVTFVLLSHYFLNTSRA